MSMERDLYLGAYLVAETEKITRIQKRRGCPNQCIRFYLSGVKFCPKCGTKIEEVGFEEIDYPDYFDILPEDKWVDALFCPRLDDRNDLIFLRNAGGDGASIDLPDTGEIVIEPGDMERCRAAFIEAYWEVMGVIESRVKSIELRFGLISYWN